MLTWNGLKQGRCAVAILGALLAAPAATDAAIIGILEEPAGVTSGVGNIRGWGYSNKGASILSPIEVFIDGEKAYEVPCCSGRKDVMEAQEGAPEDTGFSGAFNWGLLEPGEHEVSVVLKSSADEMKTLTQTITTVRLSEQTFLKRVRFSEDSSCTFVNASPGEGDASFRCTKMLSETNSGIVDLCLGNLTISWDKSSQSFKMTSDCEDACTKDSDCDDGIFCNGVESCDVESGLCVALSSCPPFLDGCVIRGGICDEATDSCLDQPNDGDCDDGVFCNGVESCDVVTGTCNALSACPPFQDGCVTRGGLCDEATDSCLDVPNDGDCDDGVFCNGIESCDVVSGSCVAVSSCPPQFPNGCVRPGGICDEPTDSCLDELDDGLCPADTTCQADGSCVF